MQSTWCCKPAEVLCRLAQSPKFVCKTLAWEGSLDKGVRSRGGRIRAAAGQGVPERGLVGKAFDLNAGGTMHTCHPFDASGRPVFR